MASEIIHVVDGSGREHYLNAAHLIDVTFTTGEPLVATIKLTGASEVSAEWTTITVRGEHAANLKRWLERRATKATTAPAEPRARRL